MFKAVLLKSLCKSCCFLCHTSSPNENDGNLKFSTHAPLGEWLLRHIYFCVPPRLPCWFLFAIRPEMKDRLYDKQGNRGDMRKIYVTRQFFEASGPQGHFFEKNKITRFLEKVNGSRCAKFQVCIVFRLARRHDVNTHIHTYTSEISNILDRLLASRGFWLFKKFCFLSFLFYFIWLQN